MSETTLDESYPTDCAAYCIKLGPYSAIVKSQCSPQHSKYNDPSKSWELWIGVISRTSCLTLLTLPPSCPGAPSVDLLPVTKRFLTSWNVSRCRFQSQLERKIVNHRGDREPDFQSTFPRIRSYALSETPENWCRSYREVGPFTPTLPESPRRRLRLRAARRFRSTTRGGCGGITVAWPSSSRNVSKRATTFFANQTFFLPGGNHGTGSLRSPLETRTSLPIDSCYPWGFGVSGELWFPRRPPAHAICSVQIQCSGPLLSWCSVTIAACSSS